MWLLIFLAMIIVPMAVTGYGAYKSSGYQKGSIVLHLDEWYKDHSKYVKAIEAELHQQGRDAQHHGGFKFIIDEKPYTLHPRIVTQARVPMQRTILLPDE